MITRINRKRVAMVEAMGPGARTWSDGELMGVLVLSNGDVVRVQVDAEHDGSFALSQVGGIHKPADCLTKSSRGPGTARAKLGRTGK